MITLKEALKVTKIKEEEVVWLKDKSSTFDEEPYTLAEIRKYFDMNNTEVSSIGVKFLFSEYGGLEFEVTGIDIHIRQEK